MCTFHLHVSTCSALNGIVCLWNRGVFSDISACAFDVNECPMLFFLYKGCDSRDSGFVMRCGIYFRNRKRRSFCFGSFTYSLTGRQQVSLLCLFLCFLFSFGCILSCFSLRFSHILSCFRLCFGIGLSLILRGFRL